MQTKVILSEEEKITIGNTNFFSVKREIISKITNLLGEIGNNKMLNKSWKNILINEQEKTFEPKISKGENYLGLPYLILDFPKKFEDENQFAVRSFFWWGNYLATFLLISGKDLEKFLPVILSNYSMLIDKEIFVSLNHDRWIHSIDSDYFSLIKNISSDEFETMIKKSGYLKLATILPLEKIENAGDYFIKQHLFFQKIAT
ncbi:hypothetical protein LBMAG27_01600 [Bacteroidota bacterium]|nr:hypothetical protein LBMAG27_01600 [Bacteroidota bacterium]